MTYTWTILLTLLAAETPRPAPPPTTDHSPEVVKLFSTKIQPLLANACAACHSTAGCGNFVLRRSTPGVAVASETMSFNMSAAAAQIDKKQPDRSSLLLKSIAAHGGARQPPLKDANSPAYKNLEQWVKFVAVANQSTSDNDAKPIDPFDPAIFNNKKR